MKKRFLNALLFGAIAFASTSTFVSCKDYDDDINHLQEQIDKLATADQLSAKVSEMQAAIAAAQSAAEAKAAAAQSVADAAKSAAESAKSAADAAAQKAADLEKSGATKAEVEAAQAAAEAAKAAAEAAEKNATEAIAKVQAELKEAADKAAQAAADAQTAADKANADVAAALERIAKLEEGAATKAEVEAAKADAAKAQETADKAVADAAKAAQDAAAAAAAAATAQSGVDAVNLAITGIQTEIAAQQTSLSNINTELEGIHTILEAAGLDGAEDGIKNLQTRVNELDEKLTAIIGEYTSMVTAVDLFISNYQGAYRNNVPDHKLQFIFVPQEKTVKFPLNEEAADAQFEFSAENKNVTTTDSLVIRVSPTNAVLDPSNVSLITSQGKDLSEYVEVKSVKRFNTLQTNPNKITRAADEGNGLWTVEFAVKEGVDLAKLAEEVAVKRGNYSYAIEYAVAVKNTQSADTRRVISSYSVEVQPSDYEPATDKILVENRDGVWKDIDNVRNRFRLNYNGYDNVAYSWETKQYKKDVPEYKWEKLAEPQIEGTTAGTEIAKNDVRYNRQLIEVGLGQDININVASFLDQTTNLPADMNGVAGDHSGYIDARGYAVKGFYVTLDKNFAIESAPSEWNAWKGYEYTNVGVDGKTPAKLFSGKQGSISINSEDAMGDIIGFRVYVVNLDGSLVDPDGRAFYVRVGEQKTEANLVTAADPVDVKLTDAKGKLGKTAGHWDGYDNMFLSEAMEITKDVFAGVDYIYSGSFGWLKEDGSKTEGWQVTVNPSAYGNNAVSVSKNDYEVIFLDNNKKQTNKAEDIKYAQVKINNPQNFLDDAAYTVRTTLFDANGMELRDLKLSFTKVMPTAADIKALAWQNEFDPTKQVFTNTPYQDVNIYKLFAGSEPQNVRLYTIMTDLAYGAEYKNETDRECWYTLAFQNIKANENSENNKNTQFMGANVSNNKIEDLAQPGYDYDRSGWNAYRLSVIAKDIDTKDHNIDYWYDFGKISLKYNYETADYETPNTYIVKSEEALKPLRFNSWSDFESTAWAKDAQPTITWYPGLAGTPTTIHIGSYSGVKNGKETKNVVVKYTVDGKEKEAKVRYFERLDGFKFFVADKEGIPYKDVNGKLVTPIETYYVNLSDYGDDNYSAEFAERKFNKADFEEFKFKPEAYNAELTYEVPTTENITKPATNALMAWNTNLRNYNFSGAAAFGEESKKIEWTSLINNDYLNSDVKVSFEPASLYDVRYDNYNKSVTFIQKTFSANPTSNGKLTLKAKDCFGHEMTCTVDVTIRH